MDLSVPYFFDLEHVPFSPIFREAKTDLDMKSLVHDISLRTLSEAYMIQSRSQRLLSVTSLSRKGSSLRLGRWFKVRPLCAPELSSATVL